MNGYSIQITDYLLAQSWQIAVLVVVVAAVTVLLRNRSAHVRYLLWLIVLAKCLVPPFLTVPLAVLPEQGEVITFTPTERMAVEPISTSAVEAPVPPAPVIVKHRPGFTTRQWLVAAWIAGACMFVLVAMVKALRTEFWLRRERKRLPKGLQSEIKELFSRLGVRISPKLWLVEGIGQPFVWGLLRGGIYLPRNFITANSTEHRRGIIGHELSHVLRFDAAVNLLQVIAQTLFWFHPLIWWANRKIRAEREKCCDEMTIARLGTKAQDYSDAIVNIVISESESIRPIPSLAVAGPAKNIEERIKTMLRPGKRFYKHPTLVTATVVLLLALLAVPTSLVLTARAQTEPAAAQSPALTRSIYYAASVGDIEQVRLHISAGTDVNEKTSTGDTVLHYAVRYGREDVVKLLIANSAHVNEKNVDGDSPLHYAVRYGREDVAKLLIANGAHVNEKNVDGDSPLHYAARYGHKNVAELLISEGADVSAKNNHGDLPIHLALRGCLLDRQKDVLELLIAKGPTLSSMHMAAYQGDLAKVKRFLEQGISVDSRDSEGRTALHYAALRGKRDVVEFLLSQGANVNPKDKDWGFIPLHCASTGGHKDIVELFISKGANIDAKDQYGWTPLDSAVWDDRKDIAEMLIRAGANVNSRYDWDQTPLIWAAQAGHADVVDLLIANGAEIDARDDGGWTPLYHAAWRGYRDVAELLISKGADVNARDDQGRSPLWRAKNTGHKEIAEMLRKDGLDRTVPDMGKAQKEIAEMLSMHGAKE